MIIENVRNRMIDLFTHIDDLVEDNPEVKIDKNLVRKAVDSVVVLQELIDYAKVELNKIEEHKNQEELFNGNN